MSKMIQLSIRIIFPPLIAAIAFIAVLYQSNSLSGSYQRLLNDVVEVHFPSAELMEATIHNMSRIKENFSAAALAAEDSFLYDNDQLAVAITADLELLKMMQPDQQRKQLQHIELLFGRYYKTAKQLAELMMHEEHQLDDLRVKLLESVDLLNNLLVGMNDFNAQAHAVLLNNIEQAHQQAVEQRQLMMIIGGLVITVLLILSFKLVSPAAVIKDERAIGDALTE